MKPSPSMSRDDRLSRLREVVDGLFVNGSGQQAARLVLTSADGRDLGGWCKGAIVDRLEVLLLSVGEQRQGQEQQEEEATRMDTMGAGSDIRTAPTSELDPATERRLRERLCFGHGHSGQYGDDGELQCSRCARFGAWDYRRQPIATLLDALDALDMDRWVLSKSPVVGRDASVGDRTSDPRAGEQDE